MYLNKEFHPVTNIKLYRNGQNCATLNVWSSTVGASRNLRGRPFWPYLFFLFAAHVAAPPRIVIGIHRATHSLSPSTTCSLLAICPYSDQPSIFTFFLHEVVKFEIYPPIWSTPSRDKVAAGRHSRNLGNINLPDPRLVHIAPLNARPTTCAKWSDPIHAR